MKYNLILTGWAMNQPLPTDEFRCLEEYEINQMCEKIMELGVNDEKGYILEVDLEMPKDKHDYFNHYPPAPEHVEVTEDMLSNLNIQCMEKLNLNHTKCTNIIPNLHHKEKYVVHYRALQCYMALGMKLKAVHRVIEFNQRPWLTQYIEFNTEQRKKAKNTFEKNFFNLMNNSVFGKVTQVTKFK